jgi:hypothetical protein
MTSSFEITKHYEMFSDDDEVTFKMREVEVVVRDRKVFRWQPSTGTLYPLPFEHMKTPSDAYQDWRERIQEKLRSYKRAIGVLERKLEIPSGSVPLVNEAGDRCWFTSAEKENS